VIPKLRDVTYLTARAFAHRLEERESVRWCFRNAIELLEFTRGLPDREGSKWWYGTLWLHCDKFYTTVRDVVRKIAVDLSLGDDLSDLNLYLSLIKQEVERAQQEAEDFSDDPGDRPASFGMELGARLAALEGNYQRLAQIVGKQ